MIPSGRLDLDVLVVGGGPAGAACAIRLAKGGSRVSIIEASDFSQFRVGETVEPSVRPLLLELGVEIDDQEWSAPCGGVSAAWGQAGAARRPSILNPHGRGWRVNRNNLDRALFEQARHAGAAAFMRCRFATAVRRARMWTFELRTDAGVLTGRAGWIVAATGRSASTPLAPNRSRVWIDRLVGIAVLGDCGEPPESRAPAEAVVEAAAHGWWYHVGIPDGRRIAIFFTDADLLPNGNPDRAAFLLSELEQAPLTESRCKFAPATIMQHRWTGFDARSGIQRLAMSDGWIAVGDAMMAFDPLCGRGISEAIRSGGEAASWLLNSGIGEAGLDAIPPWIQHTADRFNEYRSQRLATYRQETRWQTSEFWQRRSW